MNYEMLGYEFFQLMDLLIYNGGIFNIEKNGEWTAALGTFLFRGTAINAQNFRNAYCYLYVKSMEITNDIGT